MNFFCVLLIILACVFALYFTLGSFVRYQGGIHHCPEVLPHYTLWCRLTRLFVRLITCGRVNLAPTAFGTHYDRGGGGGSTTSPVMMDPYSYDEGWGVAAPLPSNRAEREVASNLRYIDDAAADVELEMPKKEAA